MKVGCKFFLISIIVVFGLYSCKIVEKLPCENAVEAKLVKLQGLDGCGWVIQLEDGSKLEPLNLNGFEIKKKNNKEIWVTYEDTQGLMSICMVGPIVKITCISER
jgi:hypothetical protein